MGDLMNKPQRVGRYVTTTVAGEPAKAYIPPPLPPAGLDLSGLHLLLDQANQALGRLDGLTVLLPDVRFLLYLYVRKEAWRRQRRKLRRPQLRFSGYFPQTGTRSNNWGARFPLPCGFTSTCSESQLRTSPQQRKP